MNASHSNTYDTIDPLWPNSKNAFQPGKALLQLEGLYCMPLKVGGTQIASTVLP
jgi:hypothetical protein